MPWTFKEFNWGGGSIGWLIALIVLILCLVAWFVGKPLTSNEVLGLLAMLAVSRLI